jgi:hypothetical protein
MYTFRLQGLFHQVLRWVSARCSMLGLPKFSNFQFFSSSLHHRPHHSKQAFSRSAILIRIFLQDVDMKASTLFGGGTTALLAGFLLAQGAPVDAIAPRDFSADLPNFSQVQLMLHNLRSRIGIPFTAMRNVGLNFNHTLEVKPYDLVLLPSGYCFSCSTSPHGGPDYAKGPNPFRNEMVEVDESQLLIACTDDSAGGKADDWPLMRACPGQEEVVRTFLLDISSYGSKIAIPKARLENAPLFEVGKHICMPED